jgi:RDD family
MKVTLQLPFARRMPARYADPDNRYFARFGSPWRRIGAAAVDWGLCYALFVLASIPLGMVQTVGRVSWEAGDFGGTPGHIVVLVTQWLVVVPILAYWTLLLPTSQTYGMRLADIRLVSLRSGNGLSYPAAAVRSVIALGTAAAVYAVFLDVTAWDEETRLDETSAFLLDASYVVAGIGCVSALVMLLSRRHRSVFDRLFGTVAVEELEATTPHFGPWGPVDAFDTSHR